jgi:hypothetical protein
MSFVLTLGLQSFFSFFRVVLGCIHKPYETYRRLAQTEKPSLSVGLIFLFVIVYFGWVSVLRVPFRSPILLTYNTGLSLLAFGTGFLLVTGLLYFLGEKYRSNVSFFKIVYLWSFSLIPTLVWFFTTSLLSVLFPPPRTTSLAGSVLSIVFITFSLSLLFWKLILYYLTLRFGLRFDLKKVIVSSFVIVPAAIVYALITYKFGIFRIPFI